MRKLTLEELQDLNNFIFPDSCEYKKRKKCDSLYIEKYEELKKRINKAIEYIENELEWDMPSLEICDMKIILEILKGDKR